MIYHQNSQLVNTSLFFSDKDGITTEHTLIAENRHQLVNMTKKYFAKLKLNCSIVWNEGKNQIRMFREMEDESNSIQSKFITIYTNTVTSKGVIKHNIKKIKNINYEYNPECKMCHKKVIKIHSCILVNGEESELCMKCKKIVNHAKEFLLKSKSQ